MNAVDSNLAREFLAFAREKNVLRFGEFKTKAGRMSPYFFNAGLFDDGAAIARLGDFYARRILAAGAPFDMLFGPAYKGIPLVVAVAIKLAERGANKPFAFNRKEAKDHGEGGLLIGAPLRGRVLIVDDVISAGTSIRAAIEIIRAQGATPCGVAVALDREERGVGHESATQEIEREHGLPVFAIARLTDLLDYLADMPELRAQRTAVERYRHDYGVGSG
ncbi:MAG: orotate phosphoribosyltransferase [Rhodocyclaceae bacterium]|nr:orotate phosphoribosyltransferase [Rhodocyclaceae bacterium]